jgi:hypothetical protein
LQLILGGAAFRWRSYWVAQRFSAAISGFLLPAALSAEVQLLTDLCGRE